MINKTKQFIRKAMPFMKKQDGNYRWPISGAGNILPGGAMNTAVGFIPVIDQNGVRLLQPKGTKTPSKRLDRTTGYSQVQNLSHNFTIEKVQGAFRAAENGDVRMLFTYYRDFFLGNGMVASELSKRKLSTLSEKYSILPADKRNPDDVRAAKVIEELLSRTPEFNASLSHLMNSIVYPVSAAEKIFEPIDENYGVNQYGLRYKLKEIYPVDYNLITYRLPYIPQSAGHSTLVGGQVVVPQPPLTSYNGVGSPEDIVYDPDAWEPDLRFWTVLPNGTIIQAPALMISPDKERHIIYRCSLLNGIARDNFGGLGKSLLFLSIMSQVGLDVFLRCLQKYGMPIIVAKVDTSQVDTVAQIMEAFGNLNIVNAMAVNKDAVIELQEMNYSGAADAHEKYIQFINDQISLLISGEKLSSGKSTGGLGTGAKSLQSAVREDIIKYDRLCLNECLKHNLFRQLLDINGIKGNIPSIVWSGGNTIEENKDLSITLYNLAQAGITPTDEAMEGLSEKLGFTIQRVNNNEKVENSTEDDNNKSDVVPDENAIDNK